MSSSKPSTPQPLSAVAARLAAAAAAVTAKRTSPEPSQDESSPSLSSPSPSDSHTTIHSPPPPPLPPRSSRYFSSPSNNYKLSDKRSSQPSAVHHKRPREPMTSFIDPDCVSTWTPLWNGPSRNVLNKDGRWTIGLQAGQTLIPHGVLKLSVLSGTVSVSGATLSSSSVPSSIFAPPSHPLPTILASSTSSSSSIFEHGALFAAVVLLDDFETGIEGIDELWTATGPGKRPLWAAPVPAHGVRGRSWTLVLEPTPELAGLKIPPSWASALTSLAPSEPIDEPPVYMIEGPQGVGKSTFARLLLNALLSHHPTVAILDLDPGQPLFTPATIVSLHMMSEPAIGPTFCRMVKPGNLESSKSIYLGCVSPKECTTRYIDAVAHLMAHYRTHYAQGQAIQTRSRRRPPQVTSISCPSVPLIVNTMGWTKGIGGDLLKRINEIVKPNKIIKFYHHHHHHHEEDILVVNDDEDMQDLKDLVIVEPFVQHFMNKRMVGSDFRTIGLLAYLYSSSNSSSSVNSSDFNTAKSQIGKNLLIEKWDFLNLLWARRPFEVGKEEFIENFYLPDHHYEKQEDEDGEEDERKVGIKDHLGFILNGTIIGIISTFNQHDNSSTSGTTSTATFICFGIIRSIVKEKPSIWIILPQSISNQNSSSSLIGSGDGLGFVKFSEPEVPVVCCCYGVDGRWVPYFSSTGSGSGSSGKGVVGGERKRVRRNVQRKWFGGRGGNGVDGNVGGGGGGGN